MLLTELALKSVTIDRFLLLNGTLTRPTDLPPVSESEFQHAFLSQWQPVVTQAVLASERLSAAQRSWRAVAHDYVVERVLPRAALMLLAAVVGAWVVAGVYGRCYSAVVQHEAAAAAAAARAAAAAGAAAAARAAADEFGSAR